MSVDTTIISEYIVFSLKGMLFTNICGMLLQYLRVLAGAYEKTQDMAKELHALGCGDLDIEGIL